ncbi:MAG: PilT/PilU family type 4a pilus ATPase [Armatimonadetes bacterium]|nr:PilT/PilU family type 4a pilus ATPase [Armatimonadota bacterium]
MGPRGRKHLSFDDLLRFAIENRASDLHLIVGVPPVLRVDGDIILGNNDALTAPQIKTLLFEVLTERQIEAFEEAWELCLAYSHPELGYFRVTLYHHHRNVEASVRIGTVQMRSIEELGLPEVVGEFVRKPNGLVLVTGPTGVGKTTTLNAMTDLINRERRCKIISVEDPIEYVHTNKLSIIVQQEIASDVKSFHGALIHILRQDPDVIVVGEMRDLDTISTTLTAAETGHLVLATLHTSSASQTIDRVIDVFPPHQQNQVRTQMASCLQGIICQKLLPRIDKPGRVLAYEILAATPAVRNLIREGKTDAMLYTTMETSRHQGMEIFDRCLRSLYEQGIITYDTAVSNALDPNRIRQ